MCTERSSKIFRSKLQFKIPQHPVLCDVNNIDYLVMASFITYLVPKLAIYEKIMRVGQQVKITGKERAYILVQNFFFHPG